MKRIKPHLTTPSYKFSVKQYSHYFCAWVIVADYGRGKPRRSRNTRTRLHPPRSAKGFVSTESGDLHPQLPSAHWL